MKFKNILLPTDFSELAQYAAEFARSLAEKYGATLHVLHVRTSVLTPGPAPELGMGVEVLVPDETELQASLDRFVAEHLSGLSVPVTSSLMIGSPAGQIAEYAKANAVDLIVIGTHARGLVNRILLGSVSKTVLESAHCPVLMIPLTAKSSS
ncbi:MAG: universal stress protein [Phycisphaerales bacterium]|nr:universal stress protein [Phycisphaerales bacterium]